MKIRRGRAHLLDKNLREEVQKSIVKDRLIISYDDAVSKYRVECELKDFSRHTIRFYDRELHHVKLHLNDLEADLNDIAEITIEEVTSIMRMLKGKGLKHNTIHARLRALRALLNWGVKRGYLFTTPFDGLKLPKVKHEVGPTLTKNQMRKLLDSPDLDSFIGLRDYVLLLTFAHTGARVSEIEDLKLQGVSFEEDAIIYNRTKNGKARRVPMSKQLNRAMKAWIKVRGTQILTDALFITHYDKPMDVRQMQKRIKHYSRITGVEKEISVSPHAFRRSFAKTMIKNGVDVFTVQALMGHSSLTQLKQYVLLYREDLRKGIDSGF